MPKGGDIVTAADIIAIDTLVDALETKLSARQLKTKAVVGQATITPVASTATSLVVTGLSVAGTGLRAMVVAATTAPNIVKEVSYNVLTNTSITLWVYRTNTTDTTINYLIIGG